ncbi:MAG: helix-turn-helix domain-containing protein [Nanoarchaeota archaeon]
MLLQKYSVADLENKFKSEEDLRAKSRIQIVIFLREGKTQREVSAELRLSTGIVPYWKKRFEQKGVKGLKDKIGRGRKSELSKKQMNELSSALDNGIKMKDGYKRGFKTKDVREFIKNKFGVIYTTRNCLKKLRKMGYTLKVPRPRNKSRNQNDVDEFKGQFKKNFPIWKKEQ